MKAELASGDVKDMSDEFNQMGQSQAQIAQMANARHFSNSSTSRRATPEIRTPRPGEVDGFCCGDRVKGLDGRHGWVLTIQAMPTGRYQSGPLRPFCWVRWDGGSGGWVPPSALENLTPDELEP